MTYRDPRVDLSAQALPQDRKLKPAQREIVQAAREFESLMIQQLLKSMRATLHPSGIDGGSTMGTYQDMMDEQMSRQLAHSGGLGLSDAISRQLLQLDPAPRLAPGGKAELGVPDPAPLDGQAPEAPGG